MTINSMVMLKLGTTRNILKS